MEKQKKSRSSKNEWKCRHRRHALSAIQLYAFLVCDFLIKWYAFPTCIWIRHELSHFFLPIFISNCMHIARLLGICMTQTPFENDFCEYFFVVFIQEEYLCFCFCIYIFRREINNLEYNSI